jgi:hypothetical protein
MGAALAKLRSLVKHPAAVVQPGALASILANRVQTAQEPGHYQGYAEIKRIIAMPVSSPMDALELEEYNRMNVQAAYFDRGWRLFPVQAEAVCSYETCQGGLLPVAVGGGKTLCALMIANKAYSKGIQQMLLLVPPQVLSQLVQTDIRWARSRVAINYPIFVLGGRSQAQRLALARSKKKGLYILPYSLLSTNDTVELLESIRPGIIIADEAHQLAKFNAARTRRVRDYVDAYHPEVVALSGTITSKSIADYWHLAKWTLRDNNPLPNSTSMAMEWAAMIDACVGGGDCLLEQSHAGPLLPLVCWAQRKFPTEKFPESIVGFRASYRKRLTTTPGVVTSIGDTLGTSLILTNQPVLEPEKRPGWLQLKEFIDGVTERWVTPNGDEIEYAVHCYKWMYELTAGFYNELSWPEVSVLAKRRGISDAAANDLLTRALIHHVCGQQYAKELRTYLMEKAKPGMDTPMLVGNEMAKNADKHVPGKLYALWNDWHGHDFDGRPERDSRAVRVCDYKINAAVKWAGELDEGAGGILWVHHQEIGRWLFDALTEAGIPALHCPAGEKSNEILRGLGDPNLSGKGNRICVCSIPAHHEGKNLQAFTNQYVVQWPRPARMAEQMIGRTHRSGQLADELTVFTNATLEFDQCNFAACLNDALYIHQTTGNRQKMIYCGYDPLPVIFPSAVLHERGFQNKMLTREQERLLTEKFEKEGK